MQQCRAVNRDQKYIFGRPEFLPHFALYTPLAWLSKFTMAPAGMDYEWADKFTNAWSGVSISMSSLVKKIFDGQEIDLANKVWVLGDFSSIDSCTAKGYGTTGCLLQMDASKLGFANSKSAIVMGMKQCFSTSLSVPFPSMGMGLTGNAAMSAWPLKMCTQNSDCATGQVCNEDLTEAIIDIADPLDELLQDTTSSCRSTKGQNNKGVARMMEYFTGGAKVSETKFAICIPKFSAPDFDNLIDSKAIDPDRDAEVCDLNSNDLWELGSDGNGNPNKCKLKVNGLASYTGVLPGMTDQPSVVFAFPPAESEAYTWPQKTERRVEWVGFNLPAGKVSLKLMRSGEAKDTMEELDNDMNEDYTMKTEVGVASGYYFELCASNGLCFQSGKFSVIAEVKDRPKPKKATQVFAGSADILEDPEAKGVFKAATKTNLATVLRVASHRIEIKDISAATRRSQGIKVMRRDACVRAFTCKIVSHSACSRAMVRTYQVEYLIHPDDTGKDNTSVEDLEERANSDAVRSAVVAGQASYATSAQTDKPNVNKIATDPSYSDVDEARKKQNEVEAANAVLIIVVAVLGGLLGCGCFCCLPVIVFMMRRKRKNGVAVMEAGQTTFAQPVAAPYSAPSAPQSVEPVALPAPPPAQLYPAPQPVPQPVTQQQQVPAVIFCSACGTRNENAKFCEKCGGALSF